MDSVKFTSDHLWVRLDGRHAKIGLSSYGQARLGDILAVQLPDVGEGVEPGEAFGEIESSRTVSDLVCPLTGRVSAINTDLEEDPALVNEDPYDAGWLVELVLSDEEEIDGLLDPDEYEALVGESE